MGGIKNILSIVGKVITVVGMLCVTIITMAMAYIMFAPDTWPKPFYLNYSYPVNAMVGNGTTLPEPTATPEPPVLPGEGVMVTTGTKIINLTDAAGNKYIRVGITLEFKPIHFEETASSGEGEAATKEDLFTAKITPKLPIIDDVIITVLSGKSYEELYTAEGKEHLRNELATRINERIEPDFTVISVYFTEFVIN